MEFFSLEESFTVLTTKAAGEGEIQAADDGRTTAKDARGIGRRAKCSDL